MATTRSDTYVAYILIHGYPAGDFSSNNGEPVESTRLMAIFDRSDVDGSGSADRVEIRGIFRY
jgi:hypothetical protein